MFRNTQRKPPPRSVVPYNSAVRPEEKEQNCEERTSMDYCVRLKSVRLTPCLLVLFCFIATTLSAQRAFACVPVIEGSDVSGGSCSDSDCSSACFSAGSGGGHIAPLGIVTPFPFQNRSWESMSYASLHRPATPLYILPVTLSSEGRPDSLWVLGVQATRSRDHSIRYDVIGGN
jgi:hypothetical protein